MSAPRASDNSKPESLEALLDVFGARYQTVLMRYFERRGAAKALAEDLVQDVFVRLAQRSESEPLENAEAYLMQTASSVWMDHHRRRKRRGEDQHVEYVEAQHAPEYFSPQRVVEGREAVRRLIDVLNALPERTRQTYVLCKIDGLKRKEVAKRFGVSISAIEKHLMKASLRIGQAFGDDE